MGVEKGGKERISAVGMRWSFTIASFSLVSAEWGPDFLVEKPSSSKSATGRTEFPAQRL